MTPTWRNRLRSLAVLISWLSKLKTKLENTGTNSGSVRYFFTLPKFMLKVMYYFYIFPIIFVATKSYQYINHALKILSKKSPLVRLSIRHTKALIIILNKLVDQLLSTKISELFSFCLSTAIEIALTLFEESPEQSELVMKNPLDVQKCTHLEEIPKLIYYEEINNENDLLDNIARGENVELSNDAEQQYFRTMKLMHHYVPSTLFKATVRLRGSGVSNELDEGEEDYHPDSPASFPATPFSRAFIMNRTSERVVSVMFAARDRLRLETQSVSRDEYSRLAAKEAQNNGQFAVFDPSQASAGIALTCGNHCAVKVGKGLCCSCRAMISLRHNAYVYFEFSVTVSGTQIPTLGLGLTAPDSPLNVMVGTWPRSIGLYSDGQILIGSRWYQTDSGEKISAGSTVGILCYLPSQTQPLSNLPEEDHLKISLRQRTSSAEESIPEVTKETDVSNARVDKCAEQRNSLPVDAPIKLSETSIKSANNTRISFTINGKRILTDEAMQLAIENITAFNAPLYPTVSLFSEETRVWCRFCEADVVYRNRQSIGAPEGVKVYCLDGSLLLSEEDQ